MNACSRRDDLLQALRSGQWPQGCGPDLREHVAACPHCAADARLLSAFAVSRDTAMRLTPAHSPGLLWWKAQLRRRRDAIDSLDRPAFAISAVNATVSLILLIAASALAWKHLAWTRVLAMLSPGNWNAWIGVPLIAVLCSFIVVAVLVGSGLAEKSDA